MTDSNRLISLTSRGLLSLRFLRRRERPRIKAGGFTLVELMIVLVILGVILGIALPSFSNVFLGTRLTNYTNELVSSVYLARGESIKRNVDVTLCASSDGIACSGTNTWGDGWIILDPGNVVLSSNAEVAPGFIVAEAGGAHTLVFDGSGLVTPAATFKICRQTPTIGGQDRQVLISNIGRTSVSTTNTGTCP